MINVGTAVGYLDLDYSKFTKGFKGALNDLKVFQQSGATVADKFSAVGAAMTKIGSSMTKSVTLPLVGIGTASVKMAADFEQGMSKVQALLGIVDKDSDAMVRLGEKAREMGAKTIFSASESADAFQFMAQAGWKVEAMLAGIEPIMLMAAGQNIDLATATSIVTDSLTAFGLTAEDTGRFVDVLTVAANESNTDVLMMGETFKYVAPIAGALGFSIEDTAIAAGLMANQGIKASQAGTTMRSAFANLVNPTDNMAAVMAQYGIEIENADGSMKSLMEIMVDMRSGMAHLTDAEKAQRIEAMFGNEIKAESLAMIKEMTEEEIAETLAREAGNEILKNMTTAERDLILERKFGKEALKDFTEEQKDWQAAVILGADSVEGLTQAEQAQAAASLFGKNAMTGWLAVLNSTEEDFNGLTDAVYNSAGAAQQFHDIFMDNLAGDFELLKSGVEEAGISIGMILLPMVRDVVQWLTNLVEKFNSMDEEQKKVIVTIAAVAAAIGPVLLIGGKLVSAVGSIISIFGAASTAITSAGGIIAAVTSPIGIVIAAVAALALAWATNFGGIRETAASVWESIKTIFTVSWNFIKGLWESNFAGIKSYAEGIWNAIKIVFETAFNHIKLVFQLFANIFKGDWAAAWQNIKDMVANIWNGIISLLQNSVNTFLNIGKAIFGGLWDGIKSVWNNITSWVSDKVNWLANKLNPANWFGGGGGGSSGSHSAGLDFVPYDNYKATLHRGERVLTATEAKEMDAKGGTTGGKGNTYNFYSPKAIDVVEAKRMFDSSEKAESLGFNLG